MGRGSSSPRSRPGTRRRSRARRAPGTRGRSRRRSRAGPSVRRWSSQTIAGRSGRRPRRSTMIVLRWVVTRQRRDRRRDRRRRLPRAPRRPRRIASPADLGILLGPAGLRRDVRLDRIRAEPTIVPAGRTRAHGRSASRRRARGRCRRSRAVLEQDAGVHDPVRVEPAGDVAERPPSRARPSRRPGTARGRARRHAGG